MTDSESSGTRPLSLLIVDDHEVVRQGLVALLGRRPEFQVVAEAGTVADAIGAARRFRPDLVVMDVRLPDGSGIEACREIRAEMPETRVVILTSYPDEDAVLSAIIAGASGYLLKQVRARDLVAALEAVGRGESLLDPAVTGRVLERVRRIATADQPDELAQLTSQERKILLLVAEGKTNKEIAAEVFLSDKTVKNYVSSILAKLNLERRAQAAAYMAKLRGGQRRLIGPNGLPRPRPSALAAQPFRTRPSRTAASPRRRGPIGPRQAAVRPCRAEALARTLGSNGGHTMEARLTNETDGTRSEAVVWIDHEQALVVAGARDGSERVEILDRALLETESAFEARTADAVLDADRVLVSGPADIRTDFERTYVAITHRPDRLVDLEPTRRPRHEVVPTI